MNDQRDATLDRVQESITWFNTGEIPPKESDSDSTGRVWAYDRSLKIGVAVHWTAVESDRRRFHTWTHTPNIPLKHSTILGGTYEDK